MSSVSSLSNSSECLTAHDDSDSTGSMSSPVHDTIIKAAINKPSPLQLTNPVAYREPIMSLKDYLHALDRHKSIDNSFLSHPSDDRMWFIEIDEIKKITNHLFDIAKQPEPHINGTNVIANNTNDDNRVHDMNIQNLSIKQTSAVDSTTKSNTFKANDEVDVKNVRSCDKGLVDVNDNNKINDASGIETSRSHPFAEIFQKFSSLADSTSHVSEVTNAPWPVSTRRTKFRINQMSSRDVPIIKTEKMARLQKQNAIDACDTKLFDERVSHKSTFPAMPPSPLGKNCIVDLLESFKQEQNGLMQSHFRHKTFIDRVSNSGSISFDCGQLDVEERSINTIRSLFQLHASTGRNVKQIQARIEAKNK